MEISPNDKVLVLYRRSDPEIHIFDMQSGELHVRIEPTSMGGIESISFRSDTRQVIFTDGLEVALWDLDSCTCIWGPRPLTYPIYKVAFSPQNNLVASV